LVEGRRILEGAEDFGGGGGIWEGRRIFKKIGEIWKTIVLGVKKRTRKKEK
jgi:hypothetical protein